MVNAPIFSLNGGEVGDEALARLDLERLQFSGSLYQNVIPRVIGSMTLRPGLEHVQDIDNGDCYLMGHAYSGSSTVVPVLSDEEMRVVVGGEFITRASVSTSVTNGDFSSFTGWADASSAGASASVSSGRLLLNGGQFAVSSAKQTLTVSGGDQDVEHGLRVVVERGPVSVRIGTTSGGSDLMPDNVDIELEDGDHSIAFTPTGSSVYIELFHDVNRDVFVTSCEIDSAGTLVLATPWSDEDLEGNIIRHTQNKDVVYCASGAYQQRMIRRYGDTSWGVQRYKIDDGPFSAYDGTVTLTPSVLTGNGTLAASASYFDSNMIGRLFRIYQSGQTVETDFTAEAQEGESVRISGVNNARKISWSITGTWVGTVKLQIASDDGSGNPTGWADLGVSYEFNSNNTGNYTDSDDNVIKYFRFIVDTGDYTSGTIQTELTYSGGSQRGISRVTGYNSATSVDIEVLEQFFSSDASSEWDYSVWSDYDGWPFAVSRFGGRLYWGKSDILNGSVPDAYTSFDDEVEGDSAPIYRSIGSGSSRGILWLLELQRLIAGTDEAEYTIKSSGYDEPLTNDAWLPIESSTRGCASLRAVKADQTGIFVQSSGTGVFSMSASDGSIDYSSSDLMKMHEEICDGSAIVDLAVQRRPDTVIWFVLANGEARALTFEPGERIVAWARVVTDGLFKRVCASRASGVDAVHFAVERDGTLRLEKLATLSECRGASKNCLADAYTYFNVESSQDTFSVPHLDGLDVTVWVNGEAIHDQGNLYTVSSSQVVLDDAVESGDVVIGLPYTGDFKSTKLAYGARNGTALFQKKKISQLGLYTVNTSLDKLLVGKDFDTLRPLSKRTATGKPLASGEVVDAYDADMNAISNDWDTDSRVCIRMMAPYPATVAAMVLGIDTNG